MLSNVSHYYPILVNVSHCYPMLVNFTKVLTNILTNFHTDWTFLLNLIIITNKPGKKNDGLNELQLVLTRFNESKTN